MSLRSLLRPAALLLALACTVAPPPTAFAQAPVYLTQWGGLGSGPGQLDYPYESALDAQGNLYVADTYNHRVQVFGPDGAFLRQWGSYGAAVGQFNYPQGIAVGPNGNVYVIDSANRRVQVFTATGSWLKQWNTFGPNGSYFFVGPRKAAVDANGNLYVVDTYTVNVFTPTGSLVYRWGANGGGAGTFRNPWGIAVDAGGTVYVSDATLYLVQAFSSSGTFLRQWSVPSNLPLGLAVDAAGHVYVTGQTEIVVYDGAGGLLYRWGTYGAGDGQFNRPYGVTVGPAGEVFVSDTYNHRIEVFGSAATRVAETSWSRLKSLYR